MKRFIFNSSRLRYRLACFLMALMTVICSDVIAQESRTFKVKHTAKDFVIDTDKNGISRIRSGKEHTFCTLESGMPALSYVTKNILLPPGSKVSDVTVTVGNPTELGQYEICDNNSAMRVWNDEVREEVHLTAGYDKGKTFPEKCMLDYYVRNIGSFTILSVDYTPLRYDTGSGRLQMYSDIQMNIRFSHTDEPLEKPHLAMKDIVRALVLNPDDVDNLYLDLYPVMTPGYLIITADSLKDAFKDFAVSKMLKGYEVMITAVEDIYAAGYGGADSIENIKRYIKDVYDNTFTDLQFLLLGGDDSIIPVRYCTSRLWDGLDEVMNHRIPCDLYYANTHGSVNWDANGDGFFGDVFHRTRRGYIFQGDDAIAEYDMNFGRLPIRNSKHIKDYIKKLYRYERDEISSLGYYNRILLSGKQVAESIGGYSDSDYWSGELADIIQENHSMVINRLFDTSSTLSGTSFRRLDLMNAISNNYNIINVDTHGDNQYWIVEDGTYSVNDAMMQSASTATLITSEACYINRFTDEPSLSEAFIRNPDNGNLAFWGCTSTGWYDPGVPGPSREMMKLFYEALFNDNACCRIGEYVSWAIANLPNTNSRSCERWLALSQELAGDPELYINLQRPDRVAPVDITINGGMGCLWQKEPDCRYTLWFDSDDQSAVNHNADSTYMWPVYMDPLDTEFFLDGSFTLGIYQNGYVPFRSDVNPFRNVIIQNEELKGLKIKAEKINISYQYDSEYPGGETVTADGSDNLLEVTNMLSIEDSFECPVGAEFEVRGIR